MPVRSCGADRVVGTGERKRRPMEPNMRKPDNHLVWAITAMTSMCTLPLGIVAIIKASSVDTFWATGKYDKAWRASTEALRWSLIGVCVMWAFAVRFLLPVAVELFVETLNRL